MNHLENFIAEYYDWKGYLVKRNIKVGRRPRGGWEMELDVIAFNPHSNHLIHIEPSLDADSWQERELRFTKKFDKAREYIFKEVFTWLNSSTPIEQLAIVHSHPKNRNLLAGAKLISIDEFVTEVRNEVLKLGTMSRNAMPEQFPLLRTLQLSHKGYFKSL